VSEANIFGFQVRRVLAPVGGSTMANVIEIAKAAITAYNEKDWNKTRDLLAADAVYNEKKGVHTGPLQTPTGVIPGSNKPIEVPACEVFRGRRRKDQELVALFRFA
jgi:hypothetical protein